MDEATRDFFRKHKRKLSGKVIEIGSFDINGGLRDIIDISVGIDMRSGRGVDMVCDVADLKQHFSDGHFDACVSAGTLEHIEDWRSFVRVTWDLVKDGGWLVFTIASLDKGRHSYPHDYWRMTNEQIKTIWPLAKGFARLGGKNGKCVSVGWIVRKEGELGSLDFEPVKVK